MKECAGDNRSAYGRLFVVTIWSFAGTINEGFIFDILSPIQLGVERFKVKAKVKLLQSIVS